MIVPCLVTNWLNCSLLKNCRPSAANSVREQVTTYMMSISL